MTKPTYSDNALRATRPVIRRAVDGCNVRSDADERALHAVLGAIGFVAFLLFAMAVTDYVTAEPETVEVSE